MTVIQLVYIYILFNTNWFYLISNISTLTAIFCLFVCLELTVPLENFLLIWRRHHCRWRAANFDLYSALMVNEQWGFFSVLHLLWHGASVYNGHFRGPVTLQTNDERLAVELSQPVLKSIAAGIRTPNLPLAERTL